MIFFAAVLHNGSALFAFPDPVERLDDRVVVICADDGGNALNVGQRIIYGETTV